MASYHAANNRSLFISALVNRSAINALMIDRKRNRQSMFPGGVA